MSRTRNAKFSAFGGVALAALTALTVAACGSSSNSGSTSAANSTPAAGGYQAATTKAASSSPKKGTAVSISVTHGPAGMYLVGNSGRALYLWMADKGTKSVCTGGCAVNWPPVTTSGTPAAGSGVTASDLGTTMRTGGVMQVTYNGHPLYYYAGDPSAGTTSGQGSDAFGAKWWLVTPSGTAITKTSTSGAGSSTSSSGSSSTSSSWS